MQLHLNMILLKSFMYACKKYDIAFGFYYSHAADWIDGCYTQL